MSTVTGPLIQGSVSNAQTGAPMAGVTVVPSSYVYTDPEMGVAVTSLTTDDLGNFSAFATPGTYTFTCTDPNAGPVELIQVVGGGVIAQGNQGFQGSQGFQGAVGSGAQGSQGVPGSQGSQGNTGSPGSQGTAGSQGNQGGQGSQGVAGSSVAIKGHVANSAALPGSGNTNGDGWITDDTGDLWVFGGSSFTNVGLVRGPAGNQGAQGFQGTVGAQGSQGNQGAQGAQGSQGSQGTQGNQGAVGSQGAQGHQGFQGAVGSQGAQGSQGNQGFQGNQGTQGNQGSQGAQGGIAVLSASLGSDVAVPATTNTTFLTTGTLAIGTWLITCGANVGENLANTENLEIKAVAATGTMSFTGQRSACGTMASAQGSLGITFIATVTVAGTVGFQAFFPFVGKVYAATADGVSGATGYTATRIA